MALTRIGLDFRVTLFIIGINILSTSSSSNVKECRDNLECQLAVEFFQQNFFSTRGVNFAKLCYNSNPNATVSNQIPNEVIEVRNFKLNSSWFGAYLVDLYGVALSPLFVGHGHLICTEYVMSRVKDGLVALQMKHYSADKVDYRFDFNQSGWIAFDKKYGCTTESPRVTNTRIVFTDYETFILIHGCADSTYQDGHHISGYLLLVSEKMPVSTDNWKKITKVFDAFGEYDNSGYPLPSPQELLTNRTELCANTQKVQKNYLCPKKQVTELKYMEKEVIREIFDTQKAREKKKEQESLSDEATAYIEQQQEYHEVPTAQITCFVVMFLSVGTSLYLTHFSF